jgi:hypothetical protein
MIAPESTGMGALDWLALLHPVLMILFVYPVVGATIRIGIHVRERRLGIHPLPATVSVEHVDHGRWVTTGTVVAVLIALLWSALAQPGPGSALAWRLGRWALLGAGVLATCLALWRLRRPAWRAGAALLAWGGLLGLGWAPEVRRLADHPLQPTFWASHFWSGWLLCGLLLFAMAAAPEIASRPAWRKLHGAIGFLVAVLLAVQAITGCRDLVGLTPFHPFRQFSQGREPVPVHRNPSAEVQRLSP